MHYYIVGINASGKKTILKAISEKTAIPIVHGTDELTKALGKPGDYRVIQEADRDKLSELWGRMAAQQLKKYGRKPFILDTHILTIIKGEIRRCDGPWIRGYDALIMIKTNPQVIFDRLEHEKDSELFTLDFGNKAKVTLLNEYQEQTEQIVNELARRYQMPTKIIEGHDLDTAVTEFMALNTSLKALELDA